MAQVPGTVSKILWHFTGGPKWNALRKRQEPTRKPQSEAYQALLSILSSHELRIGQYREVVHVKVPERRFDAVRKKFKTVGYKMVQIESASVCCLSDIPIAHLSYQAKRYGKIAIGFHREVVVRHGFNPVFYTLNNTRVIRSLHEGFQQLGSLDGESVYSMADDLQSSVYGLHCEHDHEVEVDIGSEVDDIQVAAQEITDGILEAQQNLEVFLAFVKTFRPYEFSTIYCEREWRCTRPFPFDKRDIAMIVLPKPKHGFSYFKHFVETKVRTLGISRSTPIVPWEDLIEH